jgi:hypothetical protein
MMAGSDARHFLWSHRFLLSALQAQDRTGAKTAVRIGKTRPFLDGMVLISIP